MTAAVDKNHVPVRPPVLTPQLPPLSLYIHIPWCVRKCPYCDFNSHESKTDLPEQDYIRALIEDLDHDLPLVQARALESIFFGGGTPSLFSGTGIKQILTAVAERIDFTPDMEITLEANPGTAEQARFAEYRRAGVNRLSIGVQSFDDLQLQNLGRIHGSHEGESAIAMARESGFENFNIDLMYALAGQCVAQAMADLGRAVDHGPTHLSWYQLTIEPNTAFYKRPPQQPDEDAMLDMQQAGFDLLNSSGYAQYEVSAFARAGRRAAHNLNYWRFGDYLGIGAGAHGKITRPDNNDIVRTRKHRQPDHYIASPLRTAQRQAITQNDLPLEFMLNALRLHEGFTVDQFEARTGLAFGQVEKQVESLVLKALLTRQANHFQPTAQGRQFLNTMLEAFL